MFGSIRHIWALLMECGDRATKWRRHRFGWMRTQVQAIQQTLKPKRRRPTSLRLTSRQAAAALQIENARHDNAGRFREHLFYVGLGRFYVPACISWEISSSVACS